MSIGNENLDDCMRVAKRLCAASDASLLDDALKFIRQIADHENNRIAGCECVSCAAHAWLQERNLHGSDGP